VAVLLLAGAGGWDLGWAALQTTGATTGASSSDAVETQDSLRKKVDEIEGTLKSLNAKCQQCANDKDVKAGVAKALQDADKLRAGISAMKPPQQAAAQQPSTAGTQSATDACAAKLPKDAGGDDAAKMENCLTGVQVQIKSAQDRFTAYSQSDAPAPGGIQDRRGWSDSVSASLSAAGSDLDKALRSFSEPDAKQDSNANSKDHPKDWSTVPWIPGLSLLLSAGSMLLLLATWRQLNPQKVAIPEKLRVPLENIKKNAGELTGENTIMKNEPRAQYAGAADKDPAPTPPAYSSPGPEAKVAEPAFQEEKSTVPTEAAAEPVQEKPQPRQPSGDPLADYIHARTTMGEREGEAWFLSGYPHKSLTCRNLNDRGLDPKAPLFFDSDDSGVFLAVEQKGQTFVFPQFIYDFSASRRTLQGVFVYPEEGGGALRLVSAATLKSKGDGWQLVKSGEFTYA
jgi:hypothetical protein